MGKRRVGLQLLFISIIAFISSCSNSGEKSEAQAENKFLGELTDTASLSIADLLKGAKVPQYKVIEGKIRANKFLSDLLLQYGLDYSEVNQALENSKEVFDVRKIITGSGYHIYCDTFPVLRAKYFVYEHDPATTYIFSFNDSLNITEYKKEIRSEIKFSTGTIESSLWESMVANNINPMLAVELSELYAWTVDFFGLQKGDQYKVIYEERFIEERSMGIGRIYGAQYTWAGKSFIAIPFIQDSTESYYDAEGASLRKAFLKAPLRFSRISSRYSSARMHPVLRVVRAHLGVDYAAPVGTPVQSVGDGRVISATYDSGNGRIVRIQHNSVYSTAYLHLSSFATGIRAGATVKQGDVIGYVGSSGLSTGPHLDFRFYVNGNPVDPLKVESPSVEPVSPENMESFNVSRTVVMGLLESIQPNN